MAHLRLPPRPSPPNWIPGKTGATAWEQPVDDSVTVTDQQAFQFAVSVADSVAMSDNCDVVETEPTEHVKFPDDSVPGFTAPEVTDAVALTQGKGIDDSVTATDALAFQFAVSVTDSVATSDLCDPVLTPAGGVDHEQDVDDTVTVTDDQTLSGDRSLNVDDQVTATDALSFQFAVSVGDTVTVTDSTDVLSGTGYEQDVTDSVTVTDLVVTALGFGGSLVGHIDFTDLGFSTVTGRGRIDGTDAGHIDDPDAGRVSPTERGVIVPA